MEKENEQNDEIIPEGEVREETQAPDEAQATEGKVSVETEGTQALKQGLAECQAQAQEYLDGWQRSRAEFANYRKRMEREQAQAYQNATGQVIKRYLEVLDDLERALKNRPQEGEGAAWSNGIELIYRKLLTYLESQGVQPMQAEGQTFDPNLHEAVTLEESPQHESGQIIEVLQPGYMLGDKILRPAMVRVAK